MTGPYATLPALGMLALSHLGDFTEITDFTTGTTPQDKALNRFYAPSRDECLRACWWLFAKKVAALAGQTEDPNTLWAYSYTLPSDCLYVRRIRWNEMGPLARVEHRQAIVPLEIDRNADKIYTDFDVSDVDNASLEYTEAITAVTKFDAEFGMALSYLWASRMAPLITGGDPFKLGDKAWMNYRRMIALAKAQQLNEEKPDEEHAAETLRARGE